MLSRTEEEELIQSLAFPISDEWIRTLYMAKSHVSNISYTGETGTKISHDPDQKASSSSSTLLPSG